MNESNESRPKFTRGEKCILTHLVITLIVTLILFIIYLVHICYVSHASSTNSVGVFDTRRSAHPDLKSFPIGLLYLNTQPIRHICNILLISLKWSVSTGNCVAMRSDPELAYLLYTWRIKYPYNKDIKIKRSIVHPHFNRDTFANNIGLIQHNNILDVHRYKFAKIKSKNQYADIVNEKMAIISWNHEPSDSGIGTEMYQIKPMPMENCSSYIIPITYLRKYEFCTMLRKGISTLIGYGAPLIDPINITVYGFFTWGERQQKYLPLIILNLSHFHIWIDNIASFD